MSTSGWLDKSLDPVWMYFIALVALGISLGIESKRRHLHADDLKCVQPREAPVRRPDVLRGVDILVFGAIVAIVVHLVSVGLPAIRAIREGHSKDPEGSLRAVILFTVVPAMLGWLYFWFSGFSKQRDLGLIAASQAPIRDDPKLRELTRARMALQLAMDGELLFDLRSYSLPRLPNSTRRHRVVKGPTGSQGDVTKLRHELFNVDGDIDQSRVELELNKVLNREADRRLELLQSSTRPNLKKYTYGYYLAAILIWAIGGWMVNTVLHSSS